MSGDATDAVPVLELDVGNTRSKWRLLAPDDSVPDRGSWAQDGTLAGLGALGGRGIRRARIVSVAGPERDLAIREALARIDCADVAFARSGVRHGRLRSGYVEPGRLGVDRWVALVAAAGRTDGAFAVVDAGSALTLDLVDGSGCHLGGWIVPGLRMMRCALVRGTAGIRFDDAAAADSSVPGRDTATAVGHGTRQLARDFVAARILAFRRQSPGATVFVTGGDGSALLDEPEQLDAPIVHCEDLVLDGLRRVLA